MNRALVALLLSAGLAAPAESQEAEARPRLALALSGGGARGIAHVGVLRAFEESGIPVDAIAGTSMGAVVGSIYATGHGATDLERVVKLLDWQGIFNGRPDRRLVPVARREDLYRGFIGVGFDFWDLRLPAGLLAEYRVNRFLIEYLTGAGYASENDFDRLPIPFHAVAAALDNGERMVLTRGNLPKAVRASMAIPLLFPPIYWEGRPLVDGGMVDNLPVDEARTFGADVVVAVDISSPRLAARDYRSAFGVASQASNLLSERANRQHHEEPDVLIRPDLGAHSFNDYTGFDTLIAQGYEAAMKAVPAIKEKLAAAGAEGRPAPPRPAPARTLEGTPIAEIRLDGNVRYSEPLIRRTFNIPIGPPFDLQKALKALDKIHATGFFEFLWLDTEPSGDAGLGIVLRVREGAANRLEVGAAYNDSEKARGVIRLKNRNTLGFGEQTEILAVASDAGQGAAARLVGDRLVTTLVGFEAGAQYVAEKPRFYEDDGTYVTRAEFLRRDLHFALRRGIKRSFLFEADVVAGNVKTYERLGLDFPVGKDEVRKVGLSAVFDNMDDRYYPSGRLRIELSADKSFTGMGASQEYWQAEAQGLGAIPAGTRGVAQVDGFVGASGGALPPYEEFRIGGPVLLPGYRIDERWGAQAAAAAVSFRYRLIGQTRAVVRAGAGNVWESRSDISAEGMRYGFGIGVFYPTRIGPVAADLGVRRGGDVLFTISIGFPH